MAQEGKKSLMQQIIVAVVISIIAGGTSPWWWSEVMAFFTPEPKEISPQPKPSEPKKNNDSKCDEPWEWDPVLESCIMKVNVPPKTFSIPLSSTIENIEGRIDFYLNIERLQGTDNQGRAIYKNNDGALQAVINIMKGNRSVGDIHEVIYDTDKGNLCKIASLPETTGWLKKMKVTYTLNLTADCDKPGSFCTTRLVNDGRQLEIKTKALPVTIGKNCSFK